MKGKFRKGQVCILQNTRDYNGVEVTVMSDYDLVYTECGEYIMGYMLDHHAEDGHEFMAEEDQLRLKHDGGDMSFGELMSTLGVDSVVDV